MKPAAGNCTTTTILSAAIWLACLLAPAANVRSAPAPTTTPAASGSGGARDLLVLGTDQRFWSADVIPFIQGKTSGTKTYLRVRGAGDSQWRLVGELEARAASLAHRGSELLVVLDNGDWKIVSDSGARSGNPLPGRADVLALAGDGDDVWAIGAGGTAAEEPVAAKTTAATSTATAPAATATTLTTTARAAPATATASTTSSSQSPDPVSLYLLSRGDWTRRDALPPELDRNDLKVVSLAVLDRKLMLAVVDSDGAVRVFTRGESGWDKGQDVTVAPAPQTRLRLLDLRGRPALWVSDRAGPGAIFLSGERWQGPVRLEPSPKLANFDRRALATALGQLRLLASDGKQRLAEQIYNADGTLAGDATEAVTAPSPLDNRVAQLIQMFVVAVLFIWMMGALRQRPDTQEAAKRVEQLNLAPIGRRLLGGAIDLLPIVIGTYVGAQFAPLSDATDGPASTAAIYASPQMAWFAAGIGLYLLHTTAFELMFARSIGKFLAGTRVAALDGTRPGALPLLTRNLLRIVDVVLVFPPLFVFFSPLRQRIGDMAAGTLVVMTEPMEPAETSGDDAASPPPSPPPPSV